MKGICRGDETDRAHTHIAHWSTMIFERKELCFVNYSMQLLFKMCTFEFGFERGF